MHTGRTLSIAAITFGITALSLRASGSSFNGNSSIAGFHAPGDNIGGDGHAHIFVARNGTEIDEIYSYNYSGGYDNRFQSNPIWTAAWPVDDIGLSCHSSG